MINFAGIYNNRYNMKYGFVRVAAAIPIVKVADCKFNAQQIETQIAIADGKGVQIIIFPELSITGYTCADLFGQSLLLEEAEMALMQIMNNTRQMDIISIIGMPVVMNSTLLNSAVVFQKGKILGIVPKTYLPNYKEFYEQRWFTSALNHPDANVRLCGQNVPVSANLLFDTPETCFGIEICEDMWAPIPPSSALALKGAEIIFNMSADNEGISKHNYVRSLVSQQSARCLAGYVFSSSGFGESTTDVVFAGNGLIYENGTLLAESERFSFKEQLVISEIDVERLRGERLTNTTFAANIGNCLFSFGGAYMKQPRKRGIKPENSKTVNQWGLRGRIPVDPLKPQYIWDNYYDVPQTIYYLEENTREMTEEEKADFRADRKVFSQRYVKLIADERERLRKKARETE